MGEYSASRHRLIATSTALPDAGQIAAPLMGNADELLAGAPEILPTEVLAAGAPEILPTEVLAAGAPEILPTEVLAAR